MNAPTGAPQLFRPHPALAEAIDFFGYWAHGAGAPHQSRALPRGAATVIIDVGGRPRIDFFAGDGRTRLDVPAAFIAGAGTATYVTHMAAAQTVVTVHFKPAGAGRFAGIAPGELENACVGLDAVWGAAGTRLHERLVDTPMASDRIAVLQSFLLRRMRVGGPATRPDVTAGLHAIEHNPSIRVAEIGAALGLSPKLLTRSFRSEVGLAPKAYLRVRRLQAALGRLDAGAAKGAAIAADLGYFDQAHFTREFRSFTALTPTQYLGLRSWLPSHVELA